jgi:RHS repeat-associated protein
MPVVNYDWDELEDNIVEEFDEAGNTLAEYTTEPDLFGNVISQNREGVESQFHFDAQGSTLAVTDDDQNVTDAFGYTAFGEVAERTGTSEVPFQYIGQKGYYADGLTGECSVRRRVYEPETQRWLAVDPECVATRILHLYKYSQNNSLRFFDPSGLLHKSIGSEGCSAKELSDIATAVEQACAFLDGGTARCLPKALKDCLAAVCAGTILTKCVKECDRAKGHHAACATAHTTKDKKTFSTPEVIKLCESAVPDGSTPAISVCYSTKGERGGISDPKSCYGAPADMMQVMFHELMHYCGSKHALDIRGKPKFEGDLVFGCMQACFGVGAGDRDDCNCGCE